MALLGALTLIMHHPAALTHRSVRPLVAELLGPDSTYGRAQMTHDLRHLRLKGIIQRLPNTNTYTLTTYGRSVTLFFTRLELRVFNVVFTAIDAAEPIPTALSQSIAHLNTELDRAITNAHISCAA